MSKSSGANTTDYQSAVQYREYKARYNRALRAGRFLECAFIDYAMLEERLLLSILHHLHIADRTLGKGCRWATNPKPRGWAIELRFLG